MVHSETGPPRGILNPYLGERKFDLIRKQPAPELAPYVAHYWFVRWDLRGQDPYPSETLPHPSVHIVTELERTTVWGVVTGRFVRVLENEGTAFGIKFRPGAFYPFAGRSVSTLTNKRVPVSSLLDNGTQLETSLVAARGCLEQLVDRAQSFLIGHLPERDENLVKLNEMVDRIQVDRRILRVDDLVEAYQVNKRWLQRLFSRYVGVSPKWVIRRYRLHEAADLISNGGHLDWTQLALGLGYFDQAHLIRDFKSIVGKTPARYAEITGNSSKE